jgi:hypothetical protein
MPPLLAIGFVIALAVLVVGGALHGGKQHECQKNAPPEK